MNLRFIEKGIVIFAIIAGTILVLVSCSKNDNNEPVAPPTTQVETPEHLKDWKPQPKVDSAQPYMAFATDATATTTLSLTAMGSTATATDVWVDTNNNGVFDEGVDKRITDFTTPISFTAASGVFTVYGKVKELTTTGNALTAADVRSNAALTKLNVADNQLSEKAMLNLVNSLPAATVSGTTASGTTAVVLRKAEGDGNSVTDAVRKAVTDKGWQALKTEKGKEVPDLPMDTEAPKAGTITEATTTFNSITLKWTAGTDNKTPQKELEYELSFYNMSTGEYKSSGSLIGVTSYEFKASPNTKYTILLSVSDEAGNSTDYDTQILTTPAAPDEGDKEAPTVGVITQAQATSYDEAIVKWTAATDNKTPKDSLTYIVWWKEKGSIGVRISGHLQNTLQYKIEGLKEKRTYIVWITVDDSAANRGTYAKKEFTTFKTVDIIAPNVGVVQVTDITYNKATVKWTAATDNRTPQAELSYKLFWQEKGTNIEKSVDIPKGAPLSYELKGLKENVAYSVWVTVRDEIGNIATYPQKDFTTPLDSLPIKAGTLMLDGVESQILKADYSETTVGNYQINFYLSPDGSRKISFLVNNKLHIGSTVDLTKKEESYQGKKNWYIWYKDDFFSTGRRASSQPVFDTGSLRVSNLPTSGNITVELKDGRIRVDGRTQCTITLKYKGTISAQPYKNGNVIVVNGEEKKIINTRFYKSKSKSCNQYIITFTCTGGSGEERLVLELYDKWHWGKEIDLRMAEAPEAYIDGYTVPTFENWRINYYKENNRLFGATSLHMYLQFDKGELITKGDINGLVKIKIENGVARKYTLSLNYEGELQ